MSKKNIIIIILILIVAFIAGIFAFYYFKEQGKEVSDLNQLKTEKPELVPYVEEIEKSSEKVNKDDIATYATSGLAWKSLGDQTQNKEYYKKALDVYEDAIIVTQRKNTLFLVNAGNMAQYLEDYQTAKNYYEEAVSVDAGDANTYQKLIELHIYKLKSDKDLIVPIFDKAIKTLLDPTSFVNWKESYLASLNNQ